MRPRRRTHQPTQPLAQEHEGPARLPLLAYLLWCEMLLVGSQFARCLNGLSECGQIHAAATSWLAAKERGRALASPPCSAQSCCHAFAAAHFHAVQFQEPSTLSDLGVILECHHVRIASTKIDGPPPPMSRPRPRPIAPIKFVNLPSPARQSQTPSLVHPPTRRMATSH